MIVEARMSGGLDPGKYAVCGACGASICRRDRFTVDPLTNAGRDYRHALCWGPEWRLVPARGDAPAHLTRDRSSQERYDLGNAPVRSQPGPGGAAYYVGFGPPDPLALCRCGAMNHMDPRTLHVQAL
jgi:hypothetical protein